jgi:hypothetical protein
MGSAFVLTMRGLAVLLLAGCWSNAQPAWTPPSTGEAPPPPQCPIRLSNDGHVFVWEADLGPIVTDSKPRQLAIYPLGDQALVAVRETHETQGPRGGSTLWRVGCDGKRLDAITIEGADFGHAALHPDRKRLFYSTELSVMMLDLASKKSVRVTLPPTRACEGKHLGQRDTVRSVTRDHVELERGSACGFDGAWSKIVMRRHIDLRLEEKATPITGIVAIEGEVWIAAGECGDAAIYRSTDWRSWKRVTVPNAQGRITLVADHHAVVMATALCSGTDGGRPASITRDRGKTWTPASKDVVEWITGEDFGSLRGGAANGQVVRWKDAMLVGTTVQWKQPPALPPPTTIDGHTVRPTAFGLYQGDERLFPR